ncbi:PKD domain-containing protein, partial [Robiginitalea aurantiaca]
MKKFLLLTFAFVLTLNSYSQDFSFIENFSTYGTGNLGDISGGAWAPEGSNPPIPLVLKSLSPGTTNALEFNGLITVHDYNTLIDNPVNLTNGVAFYFGTYFKMNVLGTGGGNRVRVAIRVDDDVAGDQWIRQRIGRYQEGFKASVTDGGPGSEGTLEDVIPGQVVQILVRGVWDGAGTITYSYTLDPELALGDNSWIDFGTHSVTGTPRLGRIFISSTDSANEGYVGPIRLSTDYTEVVTEAPVRGPVASFTSSTDGLDITLDGTGTQDDGTITGYAWNFGDGNTDSSSGVSTSHTYVAAGTYTVTLTATDNDGLVSEVFSEDITVTEPVVATFPYLINFQDENTTPPVGYFKDYGLPYGANEGGLTYGWIALSSGLPIDLTTPSSGVGRNRGGFDQLDLRQETLVHMQGNDIGSWTGNRSNEGVWEIEVPNGWYEVGVSVGDPNQDGQVSETPDHFISVEGVTAIPVFDVDSNLPNGDPGRFASGLVRVQVLDGKLTIDADDPAANNTKINFATIAESTPPSTETDILTFTHPAETGEAIIDAVNHTVDIEVAAGTDLATLSPVITLSDGAQVSPASEIPTDFSAGPV